MNVIKAKNYIKIIGKKLGPFFLDLQMHFFLLSLPMGEIGLSPMTLP